MQSTGVGQCNLGCDKGSVLTVKGKMLILQEQGWAANIMRGNRQDKGVGKRQKGRKRWCGGMACKSRGWRADLRINGV
jgi:hypothetical protein